MRKKVGVKWINFLLSAFYLATHVDPFSMIFEIYVHLWLDFAFIYSLWKVFLLHLCIVLYLSNDLDYRYMLPLIGNHSNYCSFVITSEKICEGFYLFCDFGVKAYVRFFIAYVIFVVGYLNVI